MVKWRLSATEVGKEAGAVTTRSRWRSYLALAVVGCAAFLPGTRALLAQTATQPAVSLDPPAIADPQPATAEDEGDAEGQAAAPPADPPSRVVRLGVLQGNVSLEPAGGNTFYAAELNGVLTSGDRVYTDPAANAELQAGQLAVRLGGGTDLTVSAMTDTQAQFGIASGSVDVHAPAIEAGTVLEVDSPQAALTVIQPGDLRVDVDPATHTTTVALLSGQAQLDSPGASQVLTAGARIRIHGADPDTGEEAYVEPVSGADADSLDTFAATRNSAEASGLDATAPYANPDTTGLADLADNGSWDTSDLGPVWYPAVAAEWRPYLYGHWRYLSPWGWTWVGAEPWGFAPFHYGRWTEIGGRWGWIPGPRIVRPVYAPALVVFAGGAQFASTLGYPAGFGVTAWFPLGPHEVYVPGYRGSTLYRNRVNASNLANPDTREVRAAYNQRAVNVYAVSTGAPASFANRAAAVAVPQSSFGLSAANRNMLRLPAGALAAAPLLAAPPAISGRAPALRRATALPPVLSRPMQAEVNGPIVGRGAASPASPATTLGARPTVLYRSPVLRGPATPEYGRPTPERAGEFHPQGNRPAPHAAPPAPPRANSPAPATTQAGPRH